MDRLVANQELNVNDQLVSNNGRVNLIMQGDGDLVHIARYSDSRSGPLAPMASQWTTPSCKQTATSSLIPRPVRRSGPAGPMEILGNRGYMRRAQPAGHHARPRQALLPRQLRRLPTSLRLK